MIGQAVQHRFNITQNEVHMEAVLPMAHEREYYMISIKQNMLNLEAISKVPSAALDFSLESHSGAFSVVTLRAATLKLPKIIFTKINLKSAHHDI